jgi:DNA-binding transcriptional MerR regulator
MSVALEVGSASDRRSPNVPTKLFKIGEVMRYTGIGRQTLHNYTVMGLITEQQRTEAGHRLYGDDVFTRLHRINSLKRDLTLVEIRELLESEEAEQ